MSPAQPDTVVIGAGAAGIAAARALRDAGREVTVLEARGRVGGRVWTARDLGPFPVELGADYVHGEHVVTWDWLRALGLEAVEAHGDDAWWAYTRGRRLDPAAFDALMPGHPFDDLREAASAGTAEEATLAAALDGWARDARPEQRAAAWGLWNSAACVGWGADLDRLGIEALSEATYEGDGDTDYHVVAGYATLFERAAAALDVRLETPVTAVEWSPHGAAVYAGAAAFACRHVVVTLPLGVLRAGGVKFHPPLPERNREAVAGLGVGHVDKVVLVFDIPFWPPGMKGVFTDLDGQSWKVVPAGGVAEPAPVLRALMGGRAAERFEAADDPVAKAARELEAVFGQELVPRLRAGRFVGWGTDPWARTGYSYVPPGGRGLRARLAEPVGGVVFFAGEATSVVRPATVHGAIESGQRAAAEVLRAT